jgi:hypothetical protein
MAVVPPYFSPIAFPNVSMAERYIASFWANAQEEYKFKRTAALKALDPKARALVHKGLQDSLTDTLQMRTDLVESDHEKRFELMKEHLKQLGLNTRSLQTSQASVSRQKISSRTSIETGVLKIKRENQAAFRMDAGSNSVIAGLEEGLDKPGSQKTQAHWGQAFLKSEKNAGNEWMAQGEPYEGAVSKLSKSTSRGEKQGQRRLALMVQLQQVAIDRNDVIGANVIAAEAMGNPGLKAPLFDLGGGVYGGADRLTKDNAANARPVLTLNLMDEYRTSYGPVYDSDIERMQARATRGGVGPAASVDLGAMMVTLGLDKPINTEIYDNRILSLRRALNKSQGASRLESEARSAIITGQAYDPYIGALETPTSELRLIDEIAKVYQQSPAAGRRLLDEASTGQLVPGESERIVLDGWRQEAVAARRRGLNEQEANRLGGNVLTFFKKELRAVALASKSAKTAEDMVDLRERLLSLSDSVGNSFVKAQLDQIRTPGGGSLSDVLGKGLRRITFKEADDAKTFATFSNRLADKLEEAQEQKDKAELSWLPYEYDEQISNLSDLYQSGDKEGYKQKAVTFRNDIDLMDPKLSGDAGRLIVNQVDLALDTENFDTLHTRMIELNDSIQNWIIESDKQMAGIDL